MVRNVILRHLALTATLIALFAPILAGAEVPPTRDSLERKEEPRVDLACEVLLSTQCFAFGGVGFAGTISDGEKALRTLMKSPKALDLLTAVLAKARPEGKLYALCGIREMSPGKFKALAEDVASKSPKVCTMSGCVEVEETTRNVVARIASGSYGLQVTGGNMRASPGAR